MKNNNKVWLLMIKTNVSAEGVLQVDEGKEKTCFWISSSFETAKENMKSIIRAYASTPNLIFDGNGLCTDFEEYMAERRDWDQFANPEEEDESDWYTQLRFITHGGYDDSAKSFWKASKLPEILKSYVMDMDNFSTDVIEEFTWTDYLMGCKVSSERIFIKGIDDGPCNGIDPYFYINTFNMDDPEKKYQFHVRNAFNDNWDYIYIDLICSEIDEDFGFPLH